VGIYNTVVNIIFVSESKNHASQIKTLKCVLTEYCRFLFRLKTATRGDGVEVCCGGGAGNGGFGHGGGGSTERL